MATTARDLFTMALRKCSGVIAEGEAPSAELMSDTLDSFNIMLDSWSQERLSVFTTQDQIFTWPAGSAQETIGPTGSFVGLRPVQLQESSYFVVSTISYGLTLVNEGQYNSIALKSAT